MAKRSKGSAGPGLFDVIGLPADSRIAKERSVDERYREPSLLDAINEARGKVYQGSAASVVGGSGLDTGALAEVMAYRVIAYGAAPTTRGYDKLTGQVERRRASLSEAVAWGRDHGGAFNVYRWTGSEWLWCCNSDTAANDEADAKIAAAPVALDWAALTATVQAEAPAGIRVDMSRAGGPETYWLFLAGSGDLPERRGKGDEQIGAVAKDGTPERPWLASRMAHGMPTARKVFETRSGAVLWASMQDDRR